MNEPHEQRTSGVASAHCIAARISGHIDSPMALALSGRFRLTVAIWAVSKV